MKIGDLTAAIRGFDPHQGEQRYLELRDLEWALRNLIGSTMEARDNWSRKQLHPVTRWDLEGDERRQQLVNAKAGAPNCTSCGHAFHHDGEFWQHYIVTDVNYPNIGTCWTKVCPELAGTRYCWPYDDLGLGDMD